MYVHFCTVVSSVNDYTLRRQCCYRNIADVTEIVPLQDVYMESTEDGNGVLISWSVMDKELYDNFTVLYCGAAAQNVHHRCNVCCSLFTQNT